MQQRRELDENDALVTAGKMPALLFLDAELELFDAREIA